EQLFLVELGWLQLLQRRPLSVPLSPHWIFCVDAQKDSLLGALPLVEEQDLEGLARPVEDHDSECPLQPLVPVLETLVSS
ncbi:hypothetical protein OFB58_27555, partial [Escherichia coli]|nr:hypothetical protein [Escherichia coli]